MNDLISKIQTELPGFSKGQKQIARYILEHYDKAAFMTASRLGVTVGVSESTVVRFATEPGGCAWRSRATGWEAATCCAPCCTRTPT